MRGAVSELGLSRMILMTDKNAWWDMLLIMGMASDAFICATTLAEDALMGADVLLEVLAAGVEFLSRDPDKASFCPWNV